MYFSAIITCMENTQNETTNANSTEQVVIKNKKNISNFITPIAIVIAGILIALSLYMRGPAPAGSSNKDLIKGALNNETKIEVADISSVDHIRGDKNAKVVVIEYSDTECPFCKNYHTTMKKIYEELGGDKQVAWVYRHFPISYGTKPLHDKAAKESEATECAAELGGEDMFWKYIDQVYEITPSNNELEPSKLLDIASSLGLDKTKFKTCLDSGKYAAKVKESYEASLKAGAKGTPYTVIRYDGEFIPLLNDNGDGLGALPYEIMKQIINQFLSQK